MGRKLLETSWSLIGLLAVMSFSESRFLHDGMNSSTLSRTKLQPNVVLIKRQQSPQTQPVAVNCHPDSMEVVVQADMFNTGLRVDSGHLRLGSGLSGEGSTCGAFPSGEAQFTIEALLMDCGTNLSWTQGKIIYSNVLVYSPEPSSDGLHRLAGATVPVACHYERRYAVAGISVHPAFIPLVSNVSAEDRIDFNLRLMSDDWQLARGSTTYFLGDTIHVEASAIVAKHVPFRVYIDHCVATTTPDAEAILRYDFIDNYGCLADAYLTNSSSHFLPRVEEHMLSFQLDAFRFYHGPSNQVYITCNMKAVPVNRTVGSQNRACSLIQKRWKSVDGNHQSCRSCDISGHAEEPLATEPPPPATTTITRSTTTSQSLVRYIHFYPGRHQSQHVNHNNPHQSSVKLVRREADYEAERTVQLRPLAVLPFGRLVSRAADSRSIRSPMNQIA